MSEVKVSQPYSVSYGCDERSRAYDTIAYHLRPDNISKEAYFVWECEGKQPDRDEHNWLKGKLRLINQLITSNRANPIAVSPDIRSEVNHYLIRLHDIAVADLNKLERSLESPSERDLFAVQLNKSTYIPAGYAIKDSAGRVVGHTSGLSKCDFT